MPKPAMKGCGQSKAGDLPLRDTLSSADPCVAARHVDSRLLGLSHIRWRAYVADQSSDHSTPVLERRDRGRLVFNLL
jgi:hypothetical protein